MSELSIDTIKCIAFEEITHIVNEAYKNNTDRKYGTVTESDANQIVGITNFANSLIKYLNISTNTKEQEEEGFKKLYPGVTIIRAPHMKIDRFIAE